MVSSLAKVQKRSSLSKTRRAGVAGTTAVIVDGTNLLKLISTESSIICADIVCSGAASFCSCIEGGGAIVFDRPVSKRL